MDIANIQHFDRTRTNEFTVLTYEGLWWQLGCEKRYVFVITSGELNEAAFQDKLADRVGVQEAAHTIGAPGRFRDLIQSEGRACRRSRDCGSGKLRRT